MVFPFDGALAGELRNEIKGEGPRTCAHTRPLIDIEHCNKRHFLGLGVLSPLAAKNCFARSDTLSTAINSAQIPAHSHAHSCVWDSLNHKISTFLNASRVSLDAIRIAAPKFRSATRTRCYHRFCQSIACRVTWY
jgi:hypothetical protein